MGVDNHLRNAEIIASVFSLNFMKSPLSHQVLLALNPVSLCGVHYALMRTRICRGRRRESERVRVRKVGRVPSESVCVSE